MKISSNKEFYTQAIKEYGVSAQGVHWNSKYTQYKRFEILTKQIRKHITTSSIIDVGSGFGEYYNYLRNNNKLPKHYIGLDCEENMINISRKRFPSVEFLHQNILEDSLIPADYYICSGAMNILPIEEVKLFIERCFQYSQKAFIFNYLKDDTFCDIKKEDILNLINKITPNIKLVEGYLENDFTIVMVK